MAINEKSRITLSILQWFALIAFIFSVGGGFAVINETATAANNKADANRAEIEQLKKDAKKDRDDIINLIHEIRESQIRIEGKLDLKQDKYVK